MSLLLVDLGYEKWRQIIRYREIWAVSKTNIQEFSSEKAINLSFIWESKKMEFRYKKPILRNWREDNFNIPSAIMLHICNNWTWKSLCNRNRLTDIITFAHIEGIKINLEKKFKDFIQIKFKFSGFYWFWESVITW